MTTKPPAQDFPFTGNVLQSLELMQKAWSASFPQVPGFPNPATLAQSVPSMMVPTLDTDELDKRITDLRAVEQWLALNASMLRTSIQALEVQRNTIATLKTLSGTLMATPLMPQPASLAPAAPDAASKHAGAPSAPKRSRRTQQKEEARPPDVTEMPLNPTAWWSTLQDQFTRIAAAAAGDAAKASAVDDANKPAARRPPPKRSGQ